MKRKADWTPEEEENLRKFPKLTNLIQRYIFENADNTAEAIASLPNNMIPANTYLDWILKDRKDKEDRFNTENNEANNAAAIDKLVQWFVVNHNLNANETTVLEPIIRDAFEADDEPPGNWDEFKQNIRSTLIPWQSFTDNANLDLTIGHYRSFFGPQNQSKSELITEGKRVAERRQRGDNEYVEKRNIANKVFDLNRPPLVEMQRNAYTEGAKVHMDLYDNE